MKIFLKIFILLLIFLFCISCKTKAEKTRELNQIKKTCFSHINRITRQIDGSTNNRKNDSILKLGFGDDLTNAEKIRALQKKAKETQRQLRIAHVLRYNRFFNTIHKIIRSGELGEILTIDHRENVAYYHMAHSFVRGNWSREENSSPMILAKSCHDLDILYWLVGEKAKKISSFGSLTHFKKSNAPLNSPKRCTDGCPVSDTCKYYAPRIYIDIIPLLHVIQKSGTKGGW